MDITGQTFGELTAIRESPTRVSKAIAWECKCSCGNELLVPRYQLLNGGKKSCGCLRKRTPANALDLTGKQFGRLKAIERAGRTKNDNALWLCKCECGNTIKANATSLRRGETVSCGCAKLDRIDNARKILHTDKSVEGVQIPLLTKKVRSDSGTGHKGVYKRVRKGNTYYEANITIKGKRYFTKQYSTIEDAIAARKRLEDKYHKPYLEDNNETNN